MCNHYRGQKVIRTSENLVGGVTKGETYTVKYLIDDRTLALEEVEGEWQRSEFADAATYVKPLDTNSVSVESLATALRIIDMWNKTRPTALMVSVEAHPAQDGGSSFYNEVDEGHDIETFITSLLKYATGRERAKILRAAALVAEQE